MNKYHIQRKFREPGILEVVAVYLIAFVGTVFVGICLGIGFIPY